MSEQIREAFEKFAGSFYNLSRDAGGDDYRSGPTREAWLAWQASHSSQLSAKDLRISELEALVKSAFIEGYNEAAPMIPHLSLFNAEKAWKDSCAIDELSPTQENSHG